MGKFHDSIKPAHREFIEKQHMFFVATAPLSAAGRVNLSPKGLDSFRVFSDTEVGYLDLAGSGNETSAHTLENGRITFMFCAFEGAPNILRLYGKGRTVLVNSPEWERWAPHFNLLPGARQIILAEIDLVQTSCGFGVPFFEYSGERSIHAEWAEKKGADGLLEYVKEKNAVSIDGLKSDVGVEYGV